jgi:hypothetical protein
MCGSTEIDGQTFCLGLDSLKPYETSPDLQSLILPVTYLIRGAIFRPKHTNWSSSTSLEIRPLGELIDMYHTHEATLRYDKVYALLGMSSDNPIAAGLSPDYKVSWEQRFQQLVKFVLGKDISVETCEDCQRAVIKSKGCLLGWVSSVTSDGRQNVKITSKNAAWSSREWSLQASAKSIRKGDIVYLLKGASKPTIIRLCRDYFAVVIIASTPLNESISFEQPELSKSITHFSRDLLLVWDWDDPLEGSQEQEEYETWTKNSQIQKYSKAELGDHMDKVTRIWNVALVLGDLEEYGKAEERLREAIKGYEMANREEHLHTLKGQYGLTPLSWVAGNGYDVVVKLLLAKDSVDPDLMDSQHGRTPLSWAAEGWHEAVVKLLLATGKVEVDSKDDHGRTPLSWAADGGHEAVVKLLLATGKVEADSKDNNSQTPLLRAAGGGHLAIVERLLQVKAEVNAAAGYGGRTALQAAAEGGHLAVRRAAAPSQGRG